MFWCCFFNRVLADVVTHPSDTALGREVLKSIGTGPWAVGAFLFKALGVSKYTVLSVKNLPLTLVEFST